MDILTYTLLLISTFTGTYFGLLLSNLAAEELIPGRKYISKTTAALIPAAVFLLIFEKNIYYAIIASALLIFALIKFEGKYRHNIIYCASAALLYISTLSAQWIAIALSSILFIHAMMLSTIDASSLPIKKDLKLGSSIDKSSNMKLAKLITVKYSAYLAVGIIVYIIFEYLIRI